MARYFKITEIDSDTFTNATGDILDCSQLVSPADGYVYVAVDESEEDELNIPFDCFEEETTDE